MFDFIINLWSEQVSSVADLVLKIDSYVASRAAIGRKLYRDVVRSHPDVIVAALALLAFLAMSF